MALLKAASFTRIVEATKAGGDVIDQPRDRGGIRDVAAEGGRLDLVPCGKVARDLLRLLPALRVHHRQMHALARQRMADALAQTAIAAGHERDRSAKLHLPSSRTNAAACRDGPALGKRRRPAAGGCANDTGLPVPAHRRSTRLRRVATDAA